MNQAHFFQVKFNISKFNLFLISIDIESKNQIAEPPSFLFSNSV
jgi:hypothetical protein